MRTLRALYRIIALLILGLGRPAAPVAAQSTPADSARVLLEAARVLEAKGQRALSRELLEVLRSRWPESPAAREAGGQLAALPDEPVSGLGRTGFIAYHTALGAWLGVAIPAALGADGPEPYGAGLLLGAPAGFIGARSYAARHHLTEGQAGIITFASEFGIWQAVGWRSVLEIGQTEECFDDICFVGSADRSPFTASLVGAVAGGIAGSALTRGPVSAGTAAMVSRAGYWGTWLGTALSILAQRDDGRHGTLPAALVGGDAAVLLAVPLAHRWQPSATRVHLISAGGLAGGLAGLGVALLVDDSHTSTTVGLVLGGNVAGMLTAAALTGARNDQPVAGSGDLPLAMLTLDHRLRLGTTMPVPALLRAPRPGDPAARVAGVKVPLVAVRF